MSIWVRCLSVFSVVVLHIAIVPVFFLGVSTPITLVVVAVVWTALLGFPAVLFPLLSVVVICDSILFGAFQFASLYFVLVAYAVSFFMRRTLLGERSGLGFFILAIFAGGAAGGYVFLNQLLIGITKESYPFGDMLSDSFLAFTLFFLLAPLLRWFELVIRTLRQEAQFAIK